MVKYIFYFVNEAAKIAELFENFLTKNFNFSKEPFLVDRQLIEFSTDLKPS